MTDPAVAQIRAEINEVNKLFNAINGFNIEQANPTQIRDQYVNQIHGRADTFSSVVHHWSPFFAYQKGEGIRHKT